jgi:hypothetical protein
VPERNAIWYADGNSGLWILRATNGVFGSTPAEGETTTAAPVATTPAAGTPAGAPAAAARTGRLPATGGPAVLLALGAALLAASLVLRRTAGGGTGPTTD